MREIRSCPSVVFRASLQVSLYTNKALAESGEGFLDVERRRWSTQLRPALIRSGVYSEKLVRGTGTGTVGLSSGLEIYRAPSSPSVCLRGLV